MNNVQVILSTFVGQFLPIVIAAAVLGSLMIFGLEDSMLCISAFLAAFARAYAAAKTVFFQTFRAEWGSFRAKRRAAIRIAKNDKKERVHEARIDAIR